MKEFLELKTPNEAKSIMDKYLFGFKQKTEIIKTEQGLGRVLATNIYSPESIPGFKRSTVDGYAVRNHDTHGATESLPVFLNVVGEIEMGKQTDLIVNPGEAVVIHTGGMVPDSADAVIMIEYTEISNANEISCVRAVGPNENIIKSGEDVKKGEMIFSSGEELRAGDIGGLMSLGITEIEVFRKPVIGILSTGDELVHPDQKINLGQIRDINSYTLKSFVSGVGAEPVLYGIVKDDQLSLDRILRKAHEESDMVIVTAGSSASIRDLTATVIQGIGAPGVLVHGINIRPGKPTILAMCNGKPIVGLPGNPVSAFVIANIFITPIVQKLRGLSDDRHYHLYHAYTTVNIPSISGREEWVPVRILNKSEKNKIIVEPIFYKSNLIFSIIKADGLIKIPEYANGLPADSQVELLIL